MLLFITIFYRITRVLDYAHDQVEQQPSDALRSLLLLNNLSSSMYIGITTSDSVGIMMCPPS